MLILTFFFVKTYLVKAIFTIDPISKWRLLDNDFMIILERSWACYVTWYIYIVISCIGISASVISHAPFLSFLIIMQKTCLYSSAHSCFPRLYLEENDMNVDTKLTLDQNVNISLHFLSLTSCCTDFITCTVSWF